MKKKPIGKKKAKLTGVSNKNRQKNPENVVKTQVGRLFVAEREGSSSFSTQASSEKKKPGGRFCEWGGQNRAKKKKYGGS